jgi:hypothetical protein
MAGARIRWWRLIGVATLCAGVSATGAAEGATAPADCPGYVAHLRSARAYLARGDRQAAADELRQAKQALDSCTRGDAGSDAVATSSAFPATT